MQGNVSATQKSIQRLGFLDLNWMLAMLEVFPELLHLAEEAVMIRVTVFRRVIAELLKQLFLACRQIARRFDEQLHEKVATLATALYKRGLRSQVIQGVHPVKAKGVKTPDRE